MSLLRTSIRGLSLAGLALALSSSIGLAGICDYNRAGCDIRVMTTTVDDPMVFCGLGTPIVSVTVRIICGECSYTHPAQHFCGTTNPAVQFTMCGKTFTVEPKSQHNWQDALNDCGDLAVTAN